VLYLRLFYTEILLGWNSEEWRTYLIWSLSIFTAELLCIFALRRKFPRLGGPNATPYSLFACFVATPMLIGLYFAAGRVSMLPISEGVHEMPRFGCCSQALVYPQSRVDDLITWYTMKKLGAVDTLTEEFADRVGGLRYALTPNVLQHVGKKSSKGAGDYTMDVIWNYAFERNDPAKLKREHEAWIEARAKAGWGETS
jgi:hypothetical protein